MKKLIIFLITTNLFFTSCKNETSGKHNEAEKTATEPSLNLVSETANLNAELKKYEVKSQVFKVSSKKQGKVKSKLGTTIFINPEDLETLDGTPLGGNIEIDLKELTNQKQLLKCNAQTISNGKLLVSGGAYYINMTSDGKQLKIKEGKSVKVDFPKLSNKEMSLFYGQKDSLGIMNWEVTDSKFITSKTDKKRTIKIDSTISNSRQDDIEDILAYTDKPLTKEEKRKNKKITKEEKNDMEVSNLNRRLYKSIELKKLGWINCDYFPEIGEKANLDYEFEATNGLIFSHVYLVFKDINSLMENWDYKNYNQAFTNIPVGSNVELIAVSIKNGKKYSFKTKLKVTMNKKIFIKLKETDEKEFEQLF